MASIKFRGKEINYASREDFWKLVETEGWEKETFDAIDRFVKPNTTFVDIGAWNGVFSIYATLKGADVIASEPDGVAYNEFSDNCEANNIYPYITWRAIMGSALTDCFISSNGGMYGTSESRVFLNKTNESDLQS